jgi:gamma-glutamyltranspeptidase
LRAAFADRERYLGDPRALEIPLARLLSPAHARSRREASDNRVVPVTGPIGAGAGDTTVVLTADAAGNAVALVQSLFYDFGACVVAGNTGVVLNNRMTGFSLDPARPSCLAPGRRPPHTLGAIMVLRNGTLDLLAATPGGDGQPQTLLQLLLNVYARNLDLQDAVEAPRFKLELDGRMQVEAEYPPSQVAALRDTGHPVETLARHAFVMGGAVSIQRDHEAGLWIGAADPRREGYAIPL